jgi:hypothetical protein
MSKLTILLAAFIATSTLVGCKESQPETSKGIEGFYHQKYTKVLTYKQTQEKVKYLECLSAQKESPAKECHEPDFLKE